MADQTIRPYQAADRAAVFRIAADTAFFGEPVENYLEDRRLFCDAFYRYYTDVESSAGLVACVGVEIAGFLMGCLDTRQQQRSWLRKMLPGVTLGILTGRYRLGPMTWRYGLRLASSAIRHEFAQCDLDEFPAHLHMNVDANQRGQGLGRRLLTAYLERLSLLGIPGVHLHTTNINVAACVLYERMGFVLLQARPTRLWDGYVRERVENRCYGFRLD